MPVRQGAAKATLAATVLGSSLAYVVGSIVNVALAAIQREFAVDAQGVQWVLNAYLLPLAALVMLGGGLGDRFGRKRIFLIGLVCFGAGAAVSAVAPTFGLMIAGRVLQGVGAAFLAPNSLSLIAAAFQGADRARAVGVWAAAGAAAGAAAPILGGWLTEAAGWRSAFLLMPPLALAAFLVAWRSVEESRARPGEAASLDWLGAAVATCALGALAAALIAWPARGAGDAWVAGGLAFGLVCCIAFILIERAKGGQAMAPPAIFARKAFAGVSLLTLFLYGALTAVLLLLPYVLIQAHGFGPAAAGLAVAPFPATLALASRFVGRRAAERGTRPFLIAGPFVVAAGFFLLAGAPATDLNYWRDMLPGVLALSVGMSLIVAPLTTAAISCVDGAFVGVAAGVNNAVARIAGLLAAALLGPVLSRAADGPEALAASFAAAGVVSGGLAIVAGLVGWLTLERDRP